MDRDEEKTQPKSIYLGWDRPVVGLAVEHLLSKANEGGDWVDLSDVLVVVPTRNAGRRLREGLAVAASGGEGGILPPQVNVPEDFLRLDSGDVKVAGSASALLAWIEELRAADLNDYRELFPIDPPDQGFDWAMKVALELSKARSALAEAGILARDVLDGDRGEQMWEHDRWKNIARLEKKVIERLQRTGLEEPEAAKIKASQYWQAPDSVKKIILMAVPDPVNLAIDAISGGSHKQDVEVCIHAPESIAEGFDQWGRPQAEFWQKRTLQQPTDDMIYLAADPAGQKDKVLDFLRSRREPADHEVAVACADGDVLPILRRGLEAAEVAVFDPDGVSFRQHVLYHFLANFSKLLSDGRFRDFLEMLRNSSWLDSLNRQFDSSKEDAEQHFDTVKVLKSFDALNERALPGSLEDAMETLRRDHERDDKYTRPLPGQWYVGDAVETMLNRFREQPFTEAFAALLADWLGARQVRSDEVDAQVLSLVGEKSRQVAEELSLVAGKEGNPADLFELLLADLSGLHYYPGDRKPSDLELQGWLELPWESANDLVVSGFNDGLVPVSVVGDMFLPELARKTLKLKTNEERFARDLYLLESMLIWRKKSSGLVKILVGKKASSGDILKPSRLLFQCEDSSLSRRAKSLFADADLSGSERAVPAWNLSWNLKPPFGRDVLMSKLPSSLSGTTFSGFLACPLRFILKRTLGMQEVDPKKSEMDAMGFGSLCHSALEVLSAGSVLGKETEYEVIYGGLVTALKEVINQQFGNHPPATVLLQAEAAASRLKVVARYHASALADGWEVVATEKVFGKGEEWLLAGFPVTGTIDRIEKNSVGRFRLVDYKTSATASTVFDAHLQPLKRTESEEDFPEWMLYELPEDGKIYRWVNLQLPVYCLWAEQHLASEGNVDCA